VGFNSFIFKHFVKQDNVDISLLQSWVRQGRLLESVARVGTFTLGVSSNVKGSIICLDYLVVVGDDLSQCEIKSQLLILT
jgi:hypothetical protein